MPGVDFRLLCERITMREVLRLLQLPILPPNPLTLGLFVPQEGQAGAGEESYHRFFVRTRENLAGIEIGGESKTVPCPLKRVNRLRVQLADRRAVLYVNDQFCLDRSEADFHPRSPFDLGCQTSLYPNLPVRLSNVRIRKWDPTKEAPAPDQRTKDKKETDRKKKINKNHAQFL